jgi:hypothetical protein
MDVRGALHDVALDAGPQAVLLADTGHGFDVPTLNGACRALMDVGAWSAALEYAADTEALVVGKPEPVFFAAALDTIGVPAEQTVMVGDDVEADVPGLLG